MAQFKVVLEFHYDSEEDISEWMLNDCNLKSVDDANDAIEVAKAEVNTHSVNEFTFKVYDEDGEYLKES